VEREDEFDLPDAKEKALPAAAAMEDEEIDIAAAPEDEQQQLQAEYAATPSPLADTATTHSLATSSNSSGQGYEGGIIGLPPRSQQLVALPITVLPDADTGAAYAARRAAALAKEKEQQAQSAAAATPAAIVGQQEAVSAPMNGQASPLMNGTHKRALDDAAAVAAVEEAKKRARV